MFEEQDRIVAADRRAQQARGIERIGREDDAQSGSMGEDALAALRVINSSAGQIAANRDANTSGDEKALFERQRMVGSSSRNCIIAGQM